MESDVRPVLVIVADVLMAEPLQMSLVQRDDVIQHLMAAAANPSFHDSVLPGTSNACPNGLDPARLQELAHFAAELAVAVEQDVSVWTWQRQRLPQLLDNPVAGWMCRRIEMENPAPLMLDDEEAVEHAEGQCRNREEVECGYHLTVVVQEGQPPLRLLVVGGSLQTLQITRDSRLRDAKAELQQFAVDSWRTPAGIVRLHVTDQLADFLTDLGPTEPPGTQSPEQPEPDAVPGDYGLRLHDDQGTSPTCPQAAESNPEETVKTAQPRPGLLPLEDSKLLAESSGLEPEAMSRDKERPKVGDCR